MAVIETKIKRWGNSFAIIIPKETIDQESMKEEENVKFILVKDSKKAIKKTFGIAKHIKKEGQQFKDDLRKELY